MRRSHLCAALVAACAFAALMIWRAGADRPSGGPRPAAAAPPAALPLRQVVLFNSGVGYFQREGTVEGDARIDLTFPAGDVNDLIKSIVLPEASKGTVRVISYDGHEPAERSLNSFSVDLTHNPTFGQLLNQARGEKVEVVLQPAGGAAPTTLTGTVLGMEVEHKDTPREAHHLNLLASDGARRVPLVQVQRVRFLNPPLEADLRRALEVLASTHNAQRRNVSLYFPGEGRREVKVGYVVESPIWKGSYRLVLDAKGGQPVLQGFGVVDNTTDEDWQDVRMALVSARPISFQMDMHTPLFMPRPMVELEHHASLRPVVYQASLPPGLLPGSAVEAGPASLQLQGIQGVQGIQGLQIQLPGTQLGRSGGIPGITFPPSTSLPPGLSMYQLGPAGRPGTRAERLSYEEWQAKRKEAANKRQQALRLGSTVALGEGLSSSSLEQTGEAFRYVLDQKVSVLRQRSALVPVLHEPVKVKRVSIYNQPIHAKFPLLGLKFENSTGQHLVQGPVSVFDQGAYAGDCRLPDLQPGEKRLISYGLDLGMEVTPRARKTSREWKGIVLKKETLEMAYRERETTGYAFRNRSREDRTLVVSFPIQHKWELGGSERPTERSAGLYRFEWSAPAGKSLVKEVVEERDGIEETTPRWSTEEGKEGLLIDANLRALGVEVRHQEKKAREWSQIALSKKSLALSYRERSTARYALRNTSKSERTVVVHHSIPKGWELLGPDRPKENVLRFELKAAPGASVVREVVTERDGKEVTAPTWVNALFSRGLLQDRNLHALGLDVQARENTTRDLSRAVLNKGLLELAYRERRSTTWSLRNRSKQERAVSVAHTVPAGWELVGAERPAAGEPDVFRFELKAAAGKTETRVAVEQRESTETVGIAVQTDKALKALAEGDVAGAAVKAALRRVLEQRGRLAALKHETARLEGQIQGIVKGQERLRANIEKVPKGAAAHKRYLDKFDQQEVLLEKLEQQLEDKQEAARKQQEALDELVAGLSAR
jgi:hypothetical protein